MARPHAVSSDGLGCTMPPKVVNGREAVDQVRALRPDIVLMDIRMPLLDGIEATRAICGDPSLATTRIVILTTFEDDEYVLQAGASGFMALRQAQGATVAAAELMNAIRTVHQGEALLSPRATRALINRYLAPAPEPSLSVPAELELLTDREREILLLVGQGLSNVEMAERLFISPQTAKTHLNRIMTLLYAHDRAQLVIIAYESGLLRPGQR